MIISYATIPYSDYVLDPYFKYDIGWKVIGFFFLNLGANVLFIVGVNIQKVYRMIKNRKKGGKKAEKSTVNETKLNETTITH